jgi:putative acetyltransferase
MMARANPTIALRPYLPADASLVVEIFRASIADLTGDDYSPRQQEAWASVADDEKAFDARLTKELTLLGTIDGSPAGFAALEGNERVDMLYVHPAAVGQGIATMLIGALEKLAAARGGKLLTADVSDSAQDFFRRRGFVARQRNTVMIGDEWLANTTMDKPLGPPAAQERPQ